MNAAEYKKQYNKLLERFNNATEYFENKDIENKEKEKHLNNFIEILKGLNYYLGKITIYTEQQVLKGFK